jgi:hypothetical protein
LNDPGSFLISCNFNKSFTCNALADLGASINLMPYSLYIKLALGSLKPTRMSIRLADRSYQYPLGIAENMLVQVGKFVFPVDFVILEMEEDSKVPLILGRPFLNTADAIIRVKNKEISLGIGEDRMVFHVDKSVKHSYSNKKDCFSIEVFENDCNVDSNVVDESCVGLDTACELKEDWFRELEESFMKDEPEEFFEECDVEAKMLELLGDDSEKDVESELLEVSIDTPNLSVGEVVGDGKVDVASSLGVVCVGAKVSVLVDGYVDLGAEICKPIDRGSTNKTHDELGCENKMLGAVCVGCIGCDLVHDVVGAIGRPPELKSKGAELGGKVGKVDKRRKKARGAYLKRKKCKVRCKHDWILMVLAIFGSTRRWKDALMKIFEKLFVANEFCDFIVCFYLDNFRDN